MNTPNEPVASTSAEQEVVTDNALVSRIRAGDAAAYDEIVARYWGRTFAMAQRFLRDSQDAEEITQDTFVRIHRSLHHFRGEAKFSTWLNAIATNLARNRYWYRIRRKWDRSLSFDSPVSADNASTLADILPSEIPSPGDDSVSHEFVERVAVCMEKLQPCHRDVLVLRNVKNHSYGEIAKKLGLNVGTVKSRIARARECLREKLGSDFASAIRSKTV